MSTKKLRFLSYLLSKPCYLFKVKNNCFVFTSDKSDVGLLDMVAIKHKSRFGLSIVPIDTLDCEWSKLNSYLEKRRCAERIHSFKMVFKRSDIISSFLYDFEMTKEKSYAIFNNVSTEIISEESIKNILAYKLGFEVQIAMGRLIIDYRLIEKFSGGDKKFKTTKFNGSGWEYLEGHEEFVDLRSANVIDIKDLCELAEFLLRPYGFFFFKPSPTGGMLSSVMP